MFMCEWSQEGAIPERMPLAKAMASVNRVANAASAQILLGVTLFIFFVLFLSFHSCFGIR